MNFPQIEEKILKFWDKNKIFEKSISSRQGRPFFSFYDGPPFATGKPHYGHILATTIKDVVLRYWTMRGFRVPRRVGWDCHGLPVENLIEKELGIKNKREIESYGIEKFNLACRRSVFRCVNDFEQTLKRVGRWADYKEAYATLDSDYTESVWWVLKQLWQQDLVYKDYRVSPYCPRCGTTLSNFEVNQGYKEVKEISVYLKFRIENFETPNAYFLVWTTTPWTLPGNVALALNPEAEYVLAKEGDDNLILARERISILKETPKIVKSFSGRDLVNLKYEPLFDSLSRQEVKNIENAFQSLPADFVSLTEGTGIVHIATMYGEDDFQLGKKFKLPFHHVVDENGLFTKEVAEFQGQFVKSADPAIIENLLQRRILYKKEEVAHTYPFCWRCDSPLLYYAFESWYVAVTKFKKELISNNKKIRWVPGHIKEGRFGQWLKEARDWNFSRNRFWGAPIPIWQCETCRKYKCIGSLAELGVKIKDLHRPYIDKIFLKCPCGGRMKRIEEVFDCWFESGSMPYAQWHYPFEKKSFVEKTFPADFIAEGLDQTRGWFYTLHVLASALTLKNMGLGKEQPAFKNVIVNGLILDPQGRKLSKRLKNYAEPGEIFNHYGADSLRYFLLTSTPIGEDYRFSSQGVEEVWRKIISTLLNSCIFFETYKEKKFKPEKKFQPRTLLDKWIISRLNELNHGLIYWMDRYELTRAARLFNDFVEDLSNWYIRRSRRKFQKPESKAEKETATQTLYQVLEHLAKLIAPFLPFLAEHLYQSLQSNSKAKSPLSVHLCDFPEPEEKAINKKLTEEMEKTRKIIALALAQRAEAKIKVRQPLNELKITGKDMTGKTELLELIKEEVNVKKITFGVELKLDEVITPSLKEEGIVREIVRQLQEMRKQAGLRPKDIISVSYSADAELAKILQKNREVFLKETLAQDLRPGRPDKELAAKKDMQIGGQKIWLGIRKPNNK